jgi:DNA-binding transcriptional ArsR family regulator
MPTNADLAAIAALVGDPGRAGMLTALMDGRALTSTELARAAGIMPQTASSHLGQMVQAGLLKVQSQGRHRYHRLASAGVAHMLESIMSVAAERSALGPVPARKLFVGPRDAALRRARTCYDHLAGEIAVAIADGMLACGHVELSDDGGLLTETGVIFVNGIGIALDKMVTRAGSQASGRLFCRPCLDWSERRPHFAGALGAALCKACLSHGWMRRMEGTRALAVTPLGEAALREIFGLRNIDDRWAAKP